MSSSNDQYSASAKKKIAEFKDRESALKYLTEEQGVIDRSTVGFIEVQTLLGGSVGLVRTTQGLIMDHFYDINTKMTELLSEISSNDESNVPTENQLIRMLDLVIKMQQNLYRNWNYSGGLVKELHTTVKSLNTNINARKALEVLRQLHAAEYKEFYNRFPNDPSDESAGPSK